jgi:hypothetical protein
MDIFNVAAAGMLVLFSLLHMQRWRTQLVKAISPRTRLK